MALTPKQAKNKGGRPKVTLTEQDWEKIESACSIQCTAEEISCLMKFSVDTLERRIKEQFSMSFADYYKKHSASGKASLRRMQYQAAEKGNIAMLIWLGKQWLGQVDKVDTPAANSSVTELLREISHKLPG